MQTLTKENLTYFPATERQKASWKEYMDSGRTRVMNISDLADFDKPDIASLDQAVHALLVRHESLRTCFRMLAGKLMQCIYEPETIDLKIEKLDYSKDLFSNYKVKHAIHQVHKTPFNLEEGPQIRFCLIHLGKGKYKLATAINHIISDAASLQVLREDFLSYYFAFAKREIVELKPLDYQLKDFAEWEQKLLQSQEGKDNLAYWNQELAEESLQDFQLIDTWNQKPLFSSLRNKHGGEYLSFIDESLMKKIHSLTWKLKTSKLCFFYAGLFILLYYLSGEKNHLVIAPISLRNTQSLRKLVGYMNTDIFLKLKIHENSSFEELIKSISEKYFQALEHRHYPMDTVLDKAHKYSSAVLNELPASHSGIQNFRPRFATKNIGKPAKFPLFIMLTEYKNGIQLNTVFNSQIIPHGVIKYVMHSYIKLLDHLAEHPQAKVASLSRLISKRK